MPFRTHIISAGNLRRGPGRRDGCPARYREEERRPVAASVLGLSTKMLGEAARARQHAARPRQHQLDIGYSGFGRLRMTSARATGPARRRSDAGRAPDRRRPDSRVACSTCWPGRTGPGSCRTPLSCRPLLLPQGVCAWVTVGERARRCCDPSNQLGLADGGCLLIRPDGYVGATLKSGDVDLIGDYLARVLPPAGGTATAAGATASKREDGGTRRYGGEGGIGACGRLEPNCLSHLPDPPSTPAAGSEHWRRGVGSRTHGEREPTAEFSRPLP